MLAELLALATPDTPLTFTVVPPGTGIRLGVDRDEDGSLDRTEIDYGFDPADPRSIGNTPPRVFSLEQNRSSGVNHIAFFSMRDRNYRLQFKDRLEDAAWSDLPDIVTSPPFEAVLSDPTATNATQRFYRVVLVE